MENPQITLFAYSKDKFTEKRLEALEEALNYKDYPVVWINIDGIAYLNELKKTFGFYDTSIRLILRSKSRPKVEIFGDYLFVLLYQVYESSGGLKREKTAIFLKDNYVITLQEVKGDVFNSIRESIRKGEGLVREKNADYLIFLLLDAVINNYVPILDKINAKMEAIEDKILRNSDREMLRKIHTIRRRILFMRRAIFPLLEVFRELQLEGTRFFEENTRPYLRELNAHVLEVLDLIESQREMANGLIDIYYSTISMRINEIMRVLTVISTIFIPLTFITGLYGMNFRYMPELSWRYGYPAVLLVMLMISLGMLYYFKRKGWL